MTTRIMGPRGPRQALRMSLWGAEDAARVTIGALGVLVVALREERSFRRRVVEGQERGSAVRDEEWVS